jgi:hypothetical protein
MHVIYAIHIEKVFCLYSTSTSCWLFIKSHPLLYGHSDFKTNRATTRATLLPTHTSAPAASVTSLACSK